MLINCIALTNIKDCEINREKALNLNVKLPNYIASITSKFDVKYVQISTDHFLTPETRPIKETDTVATVNIYGETKLACEELLKSKYTDVIIARTNFFGQDSIRKNSLCDWVISNLQNRVRVTGFINIAFNPVSIRFLAESITSLVINDFSGLINISSNECISKYDFLRKIALQLKLPEDLIQPSKYLPQINGLKRSNYMCLDNSLLKEITKIQVPTLDDMIRHTFTFSQLEMN